jgi:hypothetical protein
VTRLIERLLSRVGRGGPATPLILPPWESEPSAVQGRITCELAQPAEEHVSEEVQRWTAKRRAALVLSLLKGETTAAAAAQRHGLKIADVEEWCDRFLLGAENALRPRSKEDKTLHEKEIKQLRRKIGDLTVDLDTLLLD